MQLKPNCTMSPTSLSNLLLFVLLSIFIVSCTKNEVSSTTDDKALEEPSIARMKQLIKEQSPGLNVVIPINQRIEMNFLDQHGNPITKSSNRTLGIRANYVCDMPGNINPYSTFSSVTRSFDCGYGYRYTVTYLVSAPVNIVASNPYFPSTVSKGTIYLKRNNTGDNTAANVVYSEDNLPVTIKDLGEDPDNPDHFLFQCTFTSGYISDANITDGPWIDPRGVFATDCDQFPAIGQGTIARYLVWGSSISPNNQPCQRSDKCFILPSDPGNLGSIAGSDVIGTCGANGVTLSQYHDFEYRTITNYDPMNWPLTGTPGNWQVVPVASSSGAPASNPYGTIRYWDVRTLTRTNFPSGVYEFRYRNRMTTGTGGPCVGAWSSPERYLFN